MDPNRTIEPKALLSVLRGALDRRIKQRARDTIVRNCKKDPAKPLVKRVVERDACDFCQRLRNSRPVLPEQVSEHFHQYCKCHFALFFQETRYKERFTSERELEKMGITIEAGAEPDDFEIRDALVMASSGRKVVFLKPAGNGPRVADTLVDGVKVEIKNPIKAGHTTVRNQILNCLYGKNRDLIKPQSDWVIISNVRSSMTMVDMEKGLEFAIAGADPLKPAELAAIRRVSLLDAKTGKMRTYELK